MAVESADIVWPFRAFRLNFEKHFGKTLCSSAGPRQRSLSAAQAINFAFT